MSIRICRLLIFFVLLFSLGFLSCSGEDDDGSMVDDNGGGDRTALRILVYTPVAGQTTGSLIQVTGRVAGSSSLQSSIIHLYRTNASSTNELVDRVTPLFTGQFFSASVTVSRRGEYFLQVSVTDTSGKSATSGEIVFTVEAVPLSVFSLPLSAGQTLYTNSRSLQVAGMTTILDGMEISSNVVTVVSSNRTRRYATETGTSWSYSVSLEEGENSVSVVSYATNDMAGQAVSCTIVRDTVAPVVGVGIPANDQKVGQHFILQGTAVDSLSGVPEVQVQFENRAPVSASVDGIGWQIVLSNVSGSGLRTNYIYARDRAGNFSTTNVVRVERAAVPYVVITSPRDAQFFLINVSTVSGTAGIEPPQSVTNVFIRNNGGDWVSASGTTAWSAAGMTLTDGTNTIEAMAVADNGERALSQKVRILRPQPSDHSGMGAVPHDGGVTFRVWAPNATSVSVAGDFNSWNKNASYLASEGNGYWSVFVSGVTDGHEYKFVIRNSGNDIWKNDPYAREVSNSVGNSIVRNRDFNWSPFTIPGHHETVIYEMHVHTWTANIPGSMSKFAKVASKAPWLTDHLAINAVELLPVAEFPGDQSWGYNPAHLFAPESSYGGYLAYKQMVEVLHQNGIAVIQDVVHNHYGPSDLDLWNFDGPDFGNGGIYFYTDHRKATPWGDTRPDYGRGEVRQFIRDNAVYWVEEMNCDGLRWDATVFIHRIAYDRDEIGEGWTLLQWCNNEVYAKKPGALSIAEDLQRNDRVTKETGPGGLGFRSQWDADFLHGMREELKKPDDSQRDMGRIVGLIGNIDNGNHTRLVKYTESHDECAGKNGKQRLLEDIHAGDARGYWAVKRAGLGLLSAIFSPGIPMIFQGQDNLEYGNWDDTVLYSWDDASSYTNHIHMLRDAIRLKRNWYNNTRGLRGNGIRVWHVNHTGKVIAFHRWEGSGGAGNDVVVIINFSNTVYYNYRLPGMPGDQNGNWSLRYNSGWSGYEYGNDSPGSGDARASGGTITFNIGGYSVLVYSQ